jgi:putative peptidoglycan lipid II flippase
VLIAGILEFLLVAGDVARHGVLPRFCWPKFDTDVKTFLKRFGPATVGSAETQIALFADTIIASFLVAGSLSALYYADRLNQLPIGVIGIAAGTVLLPEMARRITAGDESGAKHAQNRAVEFTLVLAVPCLVAFIMVPELIMRGLFGRGAFTAANAAAEAATLTAYAIGLLPFVLMRSATTTFLARGDTITPVKALFVAVAVNVALKIVLMGSYAQVGLAIATSIGAWVNLLLLVWFASRQNLIVVDARLRQAVVKLLGAAVALAAAIWGAEWTVFRVIPAGTAFRDEMALAAVVLVSAVIYGGIIAVLFGRQLLTALRRSGGGATPPPPVVE